MVASMAGDGNGIEQKTPMELGITSTDVRQEMTKSYMEYAMSVILGRAMPDVRDGLKPVHRRILYAMHELGLSPNGQFRKSARVVGEVLGKYHPHGDTAVYDALVRMAQDFSMSVPLVNGHGNFGSTDGDPAAAMRYTECKLSPITKEALLSDLDRDTVSFISNFDGSEEEPLVLPVKLPNLLVNGSSGIAVGMATNIPPHNLGEIVTALIALIENPDISDESLFQLVLAPDFPTGGVILGTDGAQDMYKTGRGRIVVRACAHSEIVETESKKRQRDAIVVTELPYQVNKAALVGKIADLVNDKKIEGVADLRDESDRNGTRIVIELKRDAKLPVVLNNLYKKTQLQSSFAGNVMALDSGRFPVRLTLRDCLTKFLDFRRETVRRRVSFDLKRTEDRLHIVEGLLLVQSNVDEVISMIRASEDSAKAKMILCETFELSDVQATSILDMQLRRLTSLEWDRLQNERNGLEKTAAKLRAILDNEDKLDGVIIEELRECAKKFAKPRRSRILEGSNLDNADISELSLTPNERCVITMTAQGYIKRMPTSYIDSQNRGTRGKRGVGRLRAGDKIMHLFSCMTHDTLISVSSDGMAYQLEAYKVPQGELSSRGVPIFQLLPAIPAGETMASVFRVTEDDEFLVLLTRCGFVKKTAIADLQSTKANGKRAVAPDPGDELKWVKRCSSGDDIVISTKMGSIIRFTANDLRQTGRQARGVRSIRLKKGDEIADMDVIRQDTEEFVLAVTSNGTGKRVKSDEFKIQRRGGGGVKGIKLTKEEVNPRNDHLAAMQMCRADDSVMLMTKGGTIVRTKIGKIPVQGRYSRGVRIQRLDDKDTVAAVVIIRDLVDEEGDEDVTWLEEAVADDAEVAG